MKAPQLDYDTEQELIESFDFIQFPKIKSSRILRCGSTLEAWRWGVVFKDMCRRGMFWYNRDGDLKIISDEEDIVHFLIYGESTYMNLHGFAPEHRL